MNPIDLETARRLIDYSGGDDSLKGLSEVQIEGAVVLQNMLSDPKIGLAYLADEVGMGKTYVALGVVAMMRYFNPMLRVLYICPSKNVQEKWVREYKSFIRHNVRVDQGRIRTREARPAAPYMSCRNVVELLQYAASGYFADFFIRKDSFSISLADDTAAWERKRDELKSLLPAHEWKGIIKSKHAVKEQYARALNYILPTFDLVVIDEAHNFKHDFESSDRNKVLSGVLGFRGGEGYIARARHALLLSATPYDRDLNQLRNQLNMVGRLDLLPIGLDEDDHALMREKLRRFMVRRLNTLKVNDQALTRNMYRREWRKGAKAEILLETDEQKLVTALVQKKVGEMLARQSHSVSFQTGLLASFESFAESTRSEPVLFDGDQSTKEQTDAKDRHVIGCIADNYVEHGLGRTLPHPKMDSVVTRLSHAMFEEARKQLVFVRRVKSVGEIKNKLDDAYNDWIRRHIGAVLSGHQESLDMLDSIYKAYLKASQKRDAGLLGGEINVEDSEQENELKPGNDTFFAWFFRGESPKEVALLLTTASGDYTTPELVRKGLAAKNQVIGTLLEPNWAWYLCRQDGLDLRNILDEHGQAIATLAGQYITGRLADDQLEIYQACQLAFIQWLIEHQGKTYLSPLLEHLAPTCSEDNPAVVELDKLVGQLTMLTLYTELHVSGLGEEILLQQNQLYTALKDGEDVPYKLKLYDVHKALMNYLLRTAHGIVDIYLARLKQGSSNLTVESRTQWMRDFVAMLLSQKETRSFSTYYELVQLASHLELIIKNNIPDIIELSRDEYPTFLRQTYAMVSPVIGASGETSGRSSQARKFRMPGYPLALVSTDVFQEGEDLHTFCDSVVHYGLSGSPISLEQKMGRVDRVSSLAQRRLMALERQAEDEDYIQVTFPYVKESIEKLQVRQVCKNINEFIESLHDIAANDQGVDDIINVDSALGCKDDVPDQIMSFLHSPYVPQAIVRNEYHAVEVIDHNEVRRNAEIDHVMALLGEKLNEIEGQGTTVRIVEDDDHDRLDGGIAARLTSAKASGELLLSLTMQAEPLYCQLGNRSEFMNIMWNESWCTFRRTLAIAYPDIKECYTLYNNAEMLVGGADITQRAEINLLFESMGERHDPDEYSKTLPEVIMGYVTSINDQTLIPIDRSGETRIHVDRADGTIALVFEFGGAQRNRKQRIALYSLGRYCIFISHVTQEGYTKKMSLKDIVKYTWARNRNIDLVEFVVDQSSAIVGRVVHPIDEMQWHEFIYCAYTLAVETDNLEYVLSSIDMH